jgi:hypothetical protein
VPSFEYLNTLELRGGWEPGCIVCKCTAYKSGLNSTNKKPKSFSEFWHMLWFLNAFFQFIFLSKNPKSGQLEGATKRLEKKFSDFIETRLVQTSFRDCAENLHLQVIVKKLASFVKRAKLLFI